MANKIVWGSDLYKGFKMPKDSQLTGQLGDILPFQMLSLEDKTLDWIKAVADYFEVVGWNNVERKAGRIQRNYWMRYGKLNQSDYLINPDVNQYYQAIGLIVPPESQSPLEQFYSIVPNFIDVLRGEFIKRDNKWTVSAIDAGSVEELSNRKNEEFKSVLTQYALFKKQNELSRLGIGEQTNPEEYVNQMQAFQQQLTNVEMSSKSFRTSGQIWADKVVRIQEDKYRLYEIEPDGFESGLITDEEYWHLDLGEDDFKLELINAKYADKHKGPNKKYVSEGDYFLWFDFGSAGDIINNFGRRMKENDILKLKEIFVQSAALLVPDSEKPRQGAYYDYRKNWEDATDLDPKMNDALLGMELAYNYTRNPNFDHNQDVDLMNPVWGRRSTGSPQMFRIMRLYWRSLRRIGFRTKINMDGSMDEGIWVDENYKPSIKPIYDKSIIKEETASNLVYGEHIEWTWAPEWRHQIKISPNQKHSFWLNSTNTYESIYIDGGPVKFQFKGVDNPFDSLPPVEGCNFSYMNTTPHSLIDRLYPYQIIHNICKNKIPKKILGDRGLKIAVDKRTIPNNFLSGEIDNIDAIADFEDKLDESDLFLYSMSRETLEGGGQPSIPQVLNLSTVQEAQFYHQLAIAIREEAGEVIGITRQRLGQSKASETATGVVQNISYSETQTEKYYEQHFNLMERVRQRMLDAAQYYTTFSEHSKEVYMNNDEENIWLDVEGLENLTAHYNLKLTSRANVRNVLTQISTFLQEENTLDIKASAKIKAIASQSLPLLLKAIEEGELRTEQNAERQRQHELQLSQQQQEAILAQEQQKFDNAMALQDSKNESAENVAVIRSMGGIQTDVNENTVPDSKENLDAYFRQQELVDNRNQKAQELASKRETDLAKLLTEKEKAQISLEKERIKGEYNLKVAEKNKNKYDKK